MKAILLILVVLLIGAPIALYVSSKPAAVTVDPVKVIGVETPVHVQVNSPHGVRRVEVDVVQDGKSYTAAKEEKLARRFLYDRHASPVTMTASVGRKPIPALHDGKAQIVVTAVANDMGGASTTKTLDVDVMTARPTVSADGDQHYINQGGSEMVTFTPGGAWTEAGVKVGDYTFRSFPLPGHPGQYFSLFAFFWQLPTDTPVYVYATNPSGAQARADFWHKVFPKQFHSSTIKLEDMNLDRIVNQIDPDHKIPGDLVQRFVYINSTMRKANNKTLADLRFQSEPKFLWTGAFLPMVDSTVEARFADQRTYTWQGKVVDKQVHLGFDLAKVAHSPIPASNDGRVVWADNLGIYGNCIVIDHGFGLQSIYGHLSEFLVKKGDMVKKGQIIGKTGSTGLAGGDHLHFTMQIDGVQVNSVEWWDPHWVKDRVLSKMGMTLEGGDAAAEPAPKAHHAKAAPAKKRRRR
ncbi:MAG TPA: M23 family metallopeptidase [Bryobacteraceae bacterium]|nr:M23 family metallopeptidase [Bryobacteraceae bacterium]